MIGVLVELYGKGAADGFYHLFEGWVIFMVSFGLLILEMAWLGRLGAEIPPRSLREHLKWGNQEVETVVKGEVNLLPNRILSPGPAYFCSVALFAPCTLFGTLLMDREENPPPRTAFVDFPMQIDGWRGQPFPLEQQYIDALRFDDYVLADYRLSPQQQINFYAAYYRSQRKGQSAHSPQSCLPGGGWEIASLTQTQLPVSDQTMQPLWANRAVIQKGDQKQIVLYWFKQRERQLTSEYLVKLYLFWDAFSRQRTDGALVRLAALVSPGESESTVDQRLLEFAVAVGGELPRFVPN